MAKTLAEKIAVMQAAERGEEIEVRACGSSDWHLPAQYFAWNWRDFDYRVKPKPQKFWVLFDINGRVMTSGTGQTPDHLVMSNPNWTLEWFERTPQ